MIGLPDLSPVAMAKLAASSDLAKDGAWQNEPRVPAGQPGGGQWTTGGAASAEPASAPNRQPTGGKSHDERPSAVGRSGGGEGGSDLLDDGVYHPGADIPALLPVGGGSEPAEGTGAEPASADPMTIDQMFPGLKDKPSLAIIAPIDRFLGVSEAADGANLDVAMGQYSKLVRDIHAVDPSWVDAELSPPGGFASLTWEERNNQLNYLRMVRALAYYNIRHDPQPLQIETARFVQREVDKAFVEGERLYQAGRLNVRLSREEAIGSYVDQQVRAALKELFKVYGVSFGAGQNININSRNYLGPNGEFRIPDARIGDIAIEWTLAPKTMASAQVRGFLRADAQPRGVIIVSPSQLGHDSPYLIPRPYGPIKKVTMTIDPRIFIPENLGDVDDQLGSMMLDAPLFTHSPSRIRHTLELAFLKLNEGLKRIRSDLGDELYERLARMSDQMKALFQADPEDKTGETAAGQRIIMQMQELIQARAKEIGYREEY
jgi:hypothetical protein